MKILITAVNNWMSFKKKWFNIFYQNIIKIDIENNSNSIINNIEMEPYKLIMGNYEEQTTNINLFI